MLGAGSCCKEHVRRRDVTGSSDKHSKRAAMPRKPPPPLALSFIFPLCDLKQHFTDHNKPSPSQPPATMSSPALVPMKYELFPLGSIKAEGWMRNELRQCGEGLGGHLFYFYRFVKDSTWLGGTWEYSALNEAAPYWYNYIVPLAFSLDELADAHLAKRLRDQAEHFLQYTLSHQSSDGWLGPETTRQTRGIWARCLLLQGLMNHALADPEKRDTIMGAILKFVKLVEDMLQRDYEGYLPKDGDEFDKQWFGVARAHELSTTLQWLYDEPEAAEYRSSIWHVMEMLWEGSRLAKRDWTEFFTEANFPQTPSVRHESPNFQHGVNVAQGI